MLLLLPGTLCLAQYDGLYSQYMFNGFILNPAYAGSHNTLNASLLYKDQWVKLEDAPSTAVASFHTPVRHSNAGVGAMFVSDQVGVHSVNYASVAGSYGIMLNRTTRLNFGLQGGMVFQKSDYNSVLDQIKDSQDAIFSEADLNSNYAQIGAGLYLYAPNYFIGISAPNINFATASALYQGESLFAKPHYFFNAGYLMDLNSSLKLQPGVLVKYIAGYSVNIDLSGHIIYRDALWLGAAYRTENALAAFFQMQVTDQLRFGYAHDMPLSHRGNIASPSHELMLSYLFTFSKRRIINPRYF
jgi:type IX secretion system PorP/SprF family membrane protein